MNLLIENWDLIVGLLALIVTAVFFVVEFFKRPNGKQIEKVKEWLVYATLEAEKSLGSSTGQLKLRLVYDMFLAKFKWLSFIVSFEMFSKLVDEALVTMRTLVETNPRIKRYVSIEMRDSND